MTSFTAEFARQAGASPQKQIVLVLDRAGWHTNVKLQVPDHVHLLFLPPYSPELQPAEYLWPLTNAALVNQHFVTTEDLEDAQFVGCATLQACPDFTTVICDVVLLISVSSLRLHSVFGPGYQPDLRARSAMTAK